MIAKRDDVIAPLTSLRFFAAFAVILFHSGSTVLRDSPIVPRPIATFFLNGYVGVTFFFVLSGFILQLVYSGRLKGRQAIGKFFEARFARIYPVYLLALLMVWPFMAPSGAMSAPQFALLQQWTITGQIDFDNWNMPAWTLSVELLFYLLFPLLNRLVSRLPKVVIFLLITCSGTFILVTASSFVVSNLTVPQSWMAYIPVPILRLPEFVIGVCLGELASRGGRSGRVSPWPPLLIAAMIVILASSTNPHVAALVTLLSAALIFTLATSGHGRLFNLLSWRPLVLLGAASYSLYLLSSPLHHLLQWSFPGRKLMLLLQYPLLIGVALLVFHFYEEPVRERLRTHWKMRRSAIAQI